VKDRPYINFWKATTCSGKKEKRTQLIAKQGKIPALPALMFWTQSQKPYSRQIGTSCVALPAAQEVTLKFISSLDF
jgi:hypothetical protein